MIHISSSSSDGDGPEFSDEYSDDGDFDYEEEEEEEDEDEEEEEEDSDDLRGHRTSRYPGESTCDHITRLLRERRDLGSLKLNECKEYLRKYGLRLTGTKSVCLERIKDHWRLKDGNGEAIYPKSSFTINCTGDVCKGDVVLFWQKTHDKSRKMSRGKNQGTRVVAGRVVKESYGTAKQQHTFTVEVLWSRGINKLPPLYPLLVKGRNLYKKRTFRLRWHDEARRLNVLAEKHKRGDEARRQKAINKGKRLATDRGDKRKNEFSISKQSKMRKTKELRKVEDRVDIAEKPESRGFGVSTNHRHQDPGCRSSQHFKENQTFARPSSGNGPNSLPPLAHHQSQMRSRNKDDRYPIPYSLPPRSTYVSREPHYNEPLGRQSDQGFDDRFNRGRFGCGEFETFVPEMQYNQPLGHQNDQGFDDRSYRGRFGCSEFETFVPAMQCREPLGHQSDRGFNNRFYRGLFGFSKFDIPPFGSRNSTYRQRR